jgi:hypothetical protein
MQEAVRRMFSDAVNRISAQAGSAAQIHAAKVWCAGIDSELLFYDA